MGHDLWFGVCIGVFMGFWVGLMFAVSFLPGRWSRNQD